MGLGNHDYENNVDDCGSNWLSPLVNSEESGNNCAYRSIMHLKKSIGKLRDGGYVINFDSYETNNNPNGTEFRNLQGSFAYSWDIGNVHFIQLNNNILYEKEFKYGYSIGMHSLSVRL